MECTPCCYIYKKMQGIYQNTNEMVRIYNPNYPSYPSYQSITVSPSPPIPEEGEDKQEENKTHVPWKVYKSDQTCIWVALIILAIGYSFFILNYFCLSYEQLRMREILMGLANSTSEHPVYVLAEKTSVVDWPCIPVTPSPPWGKVENPGSTAW